MQHHNQAQTRLERVVRLMQISGCSLQQAAAAIEHADRTTRQKRTT